MLQQTEKSKMTTKNTTEIKIKLKTNTNKKTNINDKRVYNSK